MTKNDPNRRVSARARATVTISFPVSGGGWGDGCDLAQVFDQARETAEGQVRNAFKPDAAVQIEALEIRAVITEESR